MVTSGITVIVEQATVPEIHLKYHYSLVGSYELKTSKYIFWKLKYGNLAQE